MYLISIELLCGFIRLYVFWRNKYILRTSFFTISASAKSLICLEGWSHRQAECCTPSFTVKLMFVILFLQFSDELKDSRICITGKAMTLQLRGMEELNMDGSCYLSFHWMRQLNTEPKTTRSALNVTSNLLWRTQSIKMQSLLHKLYIFLKISTSGEIPN